jgi:hypothetical protein
MNKASRSAAACGGECIDEKKEEVARKELVKWFDVRDIVVGSRYSSPDLELGLRWARDCEHKDAKWLNQENVP